MTEFIWEKQIMLRLESSLENSFIRMCKRYGIWQIKLGFRALPDRMVFLKTGRVMFIEFKRYGKSPRPNQASRIRKLIKHNFQVEVIDDSITLITTVKRLSEENSSKDPEK